jgi:hypothetical protein
MKPMEDGCSDSGDSTRQVGGRCGKVVAKDAVAISVDARGA